MARNRKRANQRRTRRPSQAGSSPQEERSSVPGVLPPVPTVTHEPSPAHEPAENGAPDPLEHATPDVELADAQLAYGRPAETEPDDEADEEEFEREVEESIVDDGSGDGGGGGNGGRRGRRGGGGYDGEAGAGAIAVPGRAHVEARENLLVRLVGFLQGSWRELQRVQWPDRRQVMQATSVVIGFVIVAAAFLGLADLVAGKIVTFILK